jgi:hypothetical protein
VNRSAAIGATFGHLLGEARDREHEALFPQQPACPALDRLDEHGHFVSHQRSLDASDGERADRLPEQREALPVVLAAGGLLRVILSDLAERNAGFFQRRAHVGLELFAQVRGVRGNHRDLPVGERRGNLRQGKCSHEDDRRHHCANIALQCEILNFAVYWSPECL